MAKDLKIDLDFKNQHDKYAPDQMKNIIHLTDENNIEYEYEYKEINDSDQSINLKSLTISNENIEENIDPNKLEILKEREKKRKKWYEKIQVNKFLKLSLLVFLISNLGYSTFFSYTSAEALSHTFYKVFEISANQFGNLFTVYAVPNTIMVFLTGIIIDLFGASKVSIILSILVTLSTLLGTLSPPNFTLMLLSRFILGFAGESLVACSNTIMSKTFKPSQLPLVIGLLVGWIYSANLLSLLLLPAINKLMGFRWSLWLVFFMSSFGLIMNILYLFLRNKLSSTINKDETEEILLEPTAVKDRSNSTSSEDGAQIKNSHIDLDILQADQEIHSEISSNSSIVEQDQNLSIFKKILIKCKSIIMTIIDIFIKIPIRMWIMVAIVFFGYIGLFGLAIIGPAFLNEKYGYDEQTAALILSSETMCSAIVSPICGIIISKFSKRIPILFVSTFLLGIGLLLLVVTNVYPVIWIIVSGIGYAILNTTIISSLPIFVPDSVIATCYGFVGTAYNLGLVLFPLILGSLRESTGNYNASFYVLFSSCMFTCLLIILLKYFDRKSCLETRLDVPSHLFKSLREKGNNKTIKRFH